MLHTHMHAHTPLQGQTAGRVPAQRAAVIGTGSPGRIADVTVSPGELRGSAVPPGSETWP